MPADALAQAAETVPVVAADTSDLLPIVSAMASDLSQLCQMMQAILALLLVFTFLYFAVRWFS